MLDSHLLIIGMGYSAQALLPYLPPQLRISATSRNPDTREQYNSPTLTMLDFPDPALEAILPEITHLLLTAAPLANGQDPFLEHYSKQLQTFCKQLHTIIYLSTTGVYGDTQGEWVDEDSLPAPINPRSERRLAVEQAWQAMGKQLGAATHLFRIAGIYGPERNILQQLQQQRAKRIDKPNQYFSRIHVDDIARTLAKTITSDTPAPPILNLCDDYPCSAREVTEYGAELLNISPPPLIAYDKAELSPMAREFYRCSRRVHNTRLKEFLDTDLRYPTYKEGLKALKQQLDTEFNT